MATLKDIAQKAGVHVGAVSYVLNNKPKAQSFRKETRERIIKIASELGYRRNALATAIKTGKSNVIGFIGGLYSSYCMDIIKGINDALSINNYMIKLLPAKTDKEVRNAACQCVEQRLAGVICRSLSETGLNILREELKPYNIPIVLVDSSFSHNWCSRVISDDFKGAKMATEYLLQLGHRRIGFVTNELILGFSKVRYDGYINMMSDWGINVGINEACFLDCSYEISAEERNLVKFFLKKQRPSAIFCASDPLAMKIINIAHSLNMKIPEDLSIIGFADLKNSALLSPALTTVAQPFVEMGKESCKILLSEIANKELPKEVKLPVKLVIRNSTARLKIKAECAG